MVSEGKPAIALPQFRAVLRERPNDAQAHYELGRCLAMLDRREAAIASFREALRFRPDWPEASNELAWLLATSPEDSLRDGATAARLAESAAKLSLRREPLLLDTLAAALAEKGDFEGAIRAQQKAIEQAIALGDEKLRAEMDKHLNAYKQGRPYRKEIKASPKTGG
jgi:Flp pilus assembly protein TadD